MAVGHTGTGRVQLRRSLRKSDTLWPVVYGPCDPAERAIRLSVSVALSTNGGMPGACRPWLFAVRDTEQLCVESRTACRLSWVSWTASEDA